MIGRPGGSVPATEWIRVTSSASSRVSGGRIPGRRRPSIVLPVPGGPARSTLCSPAAASSSARRPRSWPRTSARSGRNGSSSSSAPGGVANGMSSSPRRYATACARWRTGTTSMPASAASGADSAAQRRRVSPARRAPSATAIVPATGRTRPSSESSPTQPCSSRRAARELVRAGEERERDRKVEARSLLAQRGGREVDGDPASAGPRQHRVDDAAVDAVLRLLAGAVGEPDDRERRQVGARRGAPRPRPGAARGRRRQR